MDPTGYEAGARVRISQQIPFGVRGLTSIVEGVVLRCGQQKTGSWFAHSRDEKLWIDRLEIRKDDGEIAVCNLDQYSRIELVGEDGASASD